MTVWIVTGLCGDYYCGCGVGHLVGVASNEPTAQRIADEAREARHSFIHTSPTYQGPRGPGPAYLNWNEIDYREVPLNELLSYSGPWARNTNGTHDGAELIES